jgi:hypothetical protein
MQATKYLRTFLMAGLLFTSLATAFAVSPASAQDVSQQKADKIREMIRLAEADKMVDAILPIFEEQMKKSIRQNVPNMPKEHVDIIAETMQDEMRASSNVFFELMIPQYDALLSEQVIDDTIAFYKTPSGKELIKATPHMATIGARVGQQWAQMIAPKAAQKAKQKAKALGYNL